MPPTTVGHLTGDCVDGTWSISLKPISTLIITWNNFILNVKFLFELRYSSEIKFYITLDVRRYSRIMSGSIFRTIKLLILINIFLVPFIIAVQNIIIRFIIGLFIGFSFILLLSFSSKIESLCKKNN